MILILLILFNSVLVSSLRCIGHFHGTYITGAIVGSMTMWYFPVADTVKLSWVRLYQVFFVLDELVGFCYHAEQCYHPLVAAT